MTAIKKGFINTGRTQVHYRSAGSGPPVILLHDSPRSSVLHLPMLEYLADRFTVIAIDTPGYGMSDRIDVKGQPEIPDFGDALARVIEGLGLERCPVYGVHTSSKITLSFAVKHPQRVAVAILDGLSLPPGGKGADPEFIRRYMAPFVVTEDGGYLAAEWTRVRDFGRWFPWFDRRAETRSKSDRADMALTHGYAMDLFMAGADFPSAYGAAMRYVALPVVSQLKARSIFMCREDDVLYRYLDDLPKPLPAGCSIERLGPDRDAHRARIRAIFEEHADFKGASGFKAPDPLKDTPAEGQVLCGYVDLTHGQMLVRKAGSGKGRPIVYIPDTPGGTGASEPLLRALAQGRVAYALELPGTGESAPLPGPSSVSFAEAIAEAIGALGHSEVDLYAEHMSAPLAIELAALKPALIKTLVLDGVPVLTKAERRDMALRYCPALEADVHGTHFINAWHMLRDIELHWPWYDGRGPAARVIDPDIDGEKLHLLLLDVLKQLPHYGEAAQAALAVDVAALLPNVTAPTVLLKTDNDVRYASVDLAAAPLKKAQVLQRGKSAEARAKAVLGALAK